MERLTKRYVDGQAWVSMNHVAASGEYECVGPAIDRLAAYEDTGLTPEDVMNLCEMDKRIRMAKMLRWEDAERDGRLVVLPLDRAKVRWIKAILAERERQDEKWGYPQENTYCEWSSILAEETGELAKELNELHFGRGDPAKMEAEAVQVAAVALSILEQAATAHGVTAKANVALGRLTAEAALERVDGGNATA